MSREPTPVEIALQRYREGSVSLGRAAKLAGVSVWRFLDVLDERDIEVNYDESDLEADLRAVQSGEANTD